MNFLQRLFGQSENTAQAAKSRLKSALAQDRSEIPVETLDTLKKAIGDAVSKHLEVDREHLQVTVSREGEAHHVVANIPVVSTRPVRPRTSSHRTMRTVRTTNPKN
jgi:cell division topological specificity factor MinE